MGGSKFQISSYQGLWVPKMALFWPIYVFLGAKNFFLNFCQKVQPKTRCLIPKPTFQHVQMPSYGHSKIEGTPKMQKFEMPITAPLGVREQKNFGFPSFSLGGTTTPKMIKIGELAVLSYLDLPWNEPQACGCTETLITQPFLLKKAKTI